MREYLTLNQFFKRRQEFGITWIDSYPTLRKWVQKDLKKGKLLQTRVIDTGTRTGIRYLIPVRNIEKFVNKFKEI